MRFTVYHSDFDFFGFFTAIGLLFLGVCFVFSAYRKYKIPIYQLTLIFLNTALFIFIGAKLFTITSNQWALFFSEGIFPQTNKLTVMGALLFGPFGLIIGKKMFGVDKSLLDLIAVPVLFAMGIQRIGCLFAGCCFGVNTNASWGVSYASFTTAHAHAFDSGAISSFDALTMPLHPVQLYLITLCCISVPVLRIFKNKVRAKGSYFLLALNCFFIGRFFIEFFRDPVTNGEAGEMVLGLKLIQIFLLFLTLLVTGVVFVRERYFMPSEETNSQDYFSLKKSFVVFVFFSVLLFFLREWFTPFENCTLFIIAFSCAYLLFSELISIWFRVSAFRSVSCFLLLLIFFVLPCSAQIALNNDKSEAFSYKEVSVTGTYHTFSHYHNPASLYTYTTSGCSGPESHSYYIYSKNQTHEVKTGSLNFAQYFNYGNNRRMFYKTSFALGQDTDDDPTHKDQSSQLEFFNLTSGSLSGGIDIKYLGLEFGLAVGQFRLGDISTGDQPTSLSAGKPECRVLPSGRLRIGAAKILYFEASAGNPLTGLNGARYPITLAMATGMGRDNGSVFRTGIGKFGPDYGGVIGAKFVLRNYFALEGNALISISPYYSVSISKYFGLKPVKKNVFLDSGPE